MKSTKIFIAFFIGCFLVVASLLAATSSPAKENPGSLPVLISLEHVSKDLHLTSLQKSVISGLRSDYRTAALKITQAKYATSSEIAQAQVALDNLGEAYNHRATAALNTAQRRRLREIERQILGATLLTAPSEQKLLALNEQQKNKIIKLDDDAKKKASAINLRADQGKLNYHQQVMALHKNRQEHATAMIKVLTPDQLKAWNASQGKKLVF